MENEKITLSHNGICSIVKICGRSGVKRFKYGSLEIEFAGIIVEDKNSVIPFEPETEGETEPQKQMTFSSEALEGQRDMDLLLDPDAWAKS